MRDRVTASLFSVQAAYPYGISRPTSSMTSQRESPCQVLCLYDAAGTAASEDRELLLRLLDRGLGLKDKQFELCAIDELQNRAMSAAVPLVILLGIAPDSLAIPVETRGLYRKGAQRFIVGFSGEEIRSNPESKKVFWESVKKAISEVHSSFAL